MIIFKGTDGHVIGYAQNLRQAAALTKALEYLEIRYVTVITSFRCPE